MTVVIVQREVETITTEWQEVYFNDTDLMALFPYHSVNEIRDIIRFGSDHPDYDYVTKTLVNDHHKSLKGTLLNIKEDKRIIAAHVEALL